jgi:hypothetical protein
MGKRVLSLTHSPVFKKQLRKEGMNGDGEKRIVLIAFLIASEKKPREKPEAR